MPTIYTMPADTLDTSSTDVRRSVRAATAAALAANTRSGNVLTADANGALGAIDGVTMAAGDRVLVKDEATAANRGIYSITSLGSAGSAFVFTRSDDADTSAEVTSGMQVYVTEGTVNADTIWTLTTDDPITLNTTSLAFALLSDSRVNTNPMTVGGGTHGTTGANSTSIGYSSTATGSSSFAVGYTANASGGSSTAVGNGAAATATSATCLGLLAAASGSDSCAIGEGSLASATDSLAVGNNSSASATDATAVGKGASAAGANAVAVGKGSSAAGASSVALGRTSTASGDESFAMGQGATATTNGIAIGGGGAAASTEGAIAIGYATTGSGTRAVAIGRATTATAENAVVIGFSADATATSAISIGGNAQATHASSISLGEGASSSAANQCTHGSSGNPINEIRCMQANGQEFKTRILTESHTLAAAATSDTTIQIPAGALVKYVSIRVTTAVTTSLGSNTFQYGVPASDARYGAAGTSGASGTTVLGTDLDSGFPRYYTAATAIRFNAAGIETFTAGVIRVTIVFEETVAPTS